jgi:propionyl-CoA synthetase
MSRTDDVINVAGHRISTGEIEEVLSGHPDVAECAVFGIRDDMKGQVPLGLFVLKNGMRREPEEVAAELVQLVRDEIGPVAFFKLAVSVPRLPKTRSGKILRRVMAQMVDGEEWKTPPTIDDPAILDELLEVLGAAGVGRWA